MPSKTGSRRNKETDGAGPAKKASRASSSSGQARELPHETPAFPSETIPAFRKALRNWYLRHQRRLPWRTAPSLYRTVVSEMMLQQTRVETALPFFERWMAELPDFTALAAASEDEVLKLWEGLGYYRRARNLQRLACKIVALPEIPRSAEAWQEFPGIGPYSAAAITSITFGTRAACVDGNVVRVLARLTGYHATLKDSTTAARLFQPLAQQLLDPADSGLHNQAMMELGATACQRSPECPRCPVAAFCEGRRRGDAAGIPRFPPRQTEKVAVVRVWSERKGHLLLTQSARQARRLARLYELPSCEQLGMSQAEVLRHGELRLRKKRSITRFVITESIFEVDDQKLPAPEKDLSWVPLADLEKITLSGPHRRWIEMILAGRNP